MSQSGEHTASQESAAERARNGVAAALTAYLLWGVFPVYFKVVQSVPPLEVLAHRIVWAVPFGAAIIALRRQWPEVSAIARSPPTLAFLSLSSALIAVNWFIYIYAVQDDQVFQASLGYYINPLMSVLVGVAFFSEKLRRPQVIAVVLAAIGVATLTAGSDAFPWISLTLAVSFACYGVIRKQVAVGGMPGLFVETLFLLPAGMIYLGWHMQDASAVFWSAGPGMNLLLVLAGPFTVVPLLMFALAARRLHLSTIGMMQFITPTLQFVVGVLYGETLTSVRLFCFICIWCAIGLFLWDAWRRSRSLRSGEVAPVA